MSLSSKHLDLISTELGITRVVAIQNTLDLLEEGATVPFIARYRKEKTGGLDEVQIGNIHTLAQRYADLEKRRESILASVAEQGKLTDDLKARLTATYSLTELEDLYLPYKRKRKTRASVAKERGLEPLATLLLAQGSHRLAPQLAQYFTADVPDAEAALQGARDIVAEWVSEDLASRDAVRHHFRTEAMIRSKVVRGKDEGEGLKYKDYFDYQELLSQCPSHRLLAMRRGEEEGVLRVIVSPEAQPTIHDLEKIHLRHPATDAGKQVQMAIADAYTRLLEPSIETEFRNLAKEKADAEAIAVFTDNLRQLLLAAPLGEKRVLALDPGFRTGCKLVCLSEQGDLLHNDTIYPHPPQSQTDQAAQRLKILVKKWAIQAIAIGNGTAGRETEQFVRSITFESSVVVFMVNESGASIYSASEVAREEFGNYDVTVRGAVSIGRRLLDPLAELVKIDPKSIGVGQYQHDVEQAALKKSLDATVVSCVNAVGINLNTAGKHLLAYVSGLGPKLAENIVARRAELGKFSSRAQLKGVARLGDKAFEQCAGFLRIRDGEHPLDNTGVHPESYPIVENMAKDLRCTVRDLVSNPLLRRQIDPKRYVTKNVGLPTLQDILKELEKPGLDPRGQAQAVAFSDAVRTIDDLREGMMVNGVVTNVTNFGAFVDIGIKVSGLIHVSQLANRFVKNPAEVVKLQQQVHARVIAIDHERQRVQLSLKD